VKAVLLHLLASLVTGLVHFRTWREHENGLTLTLTLNLNLTPTLTLTLKSILARCKNGLEPLVTSDPGHF